mmetsp:Transcript_15605/g.34097  ORF Transcript_15605/g.34097 Transcript_15605/m.34097 type:complete len:744 (-) Transcript_15605:158-2389(-)|eukprot:CAMPEP_0168749528 /NCGR_PEP_ID=MMETSP0724-20121128/16764_1 /TAXON_ID=265536 /ORGANISM="Amphiprora sp., Strain CCMP467" /LENGTH=743 /DNA_ID=CAMNT_0008797443 /DNA_START=370 /DNA_END=2601 /DNA_ORIENTATION=-
MSEQEASSNDVLNMSIDDGDLMQPENNANHLSPPQPERLPLKHASTPATSCMSQESSPSISSRATAADIDEYSQVVADDAKASEMTAHSSDDNDNIRSINNNNNKNNDNQNSNLSRKHSASSSSTVWVPMPSPRRPRLDPRYAARLVTTPSTPFWPPQQPSSVQDATTQLTTDESPIPVLKSPAIRRETELANPPTITRDRSNIFRPTPILTNMDIDVAGVSNDESFATQRYTPSASDVLATPRRTSEHEVASDVGMSDRFIANRATSNLNMNLWEAATTPRRQEVRQDRSNSNASDEGDNVNNATSTSTTGNASQQNFLHTLLRSELLGENDQNDNSMAQTPNSTASANGGRPLQVGRQVNNLRYTSPRMAFQENVFSDSVGPASVVNSFSLTPVRSAASQRLMAAPPKRKRRISKVPFKVLDAPALQDDFYLNLVDWSSQNVLAVGLGSCVYLWSACTSKVTKLCDLEATEDTVTSVAWAQRGTHLAVGTSRGEVQLWDTIQSKKVRSMAGHSSRVGALAWTGPVLASGSRDRLIYLRDVRVQASYTDKLNNHKQEVCGLKWSFDEPAFLASGGNDNHLHVIDSRHPSIPVHKFTEHTAAVKAITWSPHQHGLLASGGGTADRCIRFWNTLSGVALNKIDTGSQVCNIAWSRNCNEIVSTHGYSLHQIVVWRYPSMTKVATLTGHTYRVLYLAMSPDGSTVVTGAGDETLRFWQIFPGPRSGEKDGAGGLLFPKTLGSVIR